MTTQVPSRRYPVGAECLGDGVSFRVWAPKHGRVAIEVDGAEHILEPDQDGYFAIHIPGLGEGARYAYRLEDGITAYPDPASRFQPEGPHGPSMVVDPSRFAWSDAEWRGVPATQRVVYEMHIGTFTPEGTWAAAIAKLPHLRDVGITMIEMMPVAEFPGHFGWGYDGVDLFAPTHLYGAPDDLRRFIDSAHGLGIGVILDVVYNHFGPDGNYIGAYSQDYFTDRHANEWGESLNYDGRNAHGLRDLVISNAAYWVDEFHFDGLRLDATQSMHDDSDDHVIAALTRAARAAGPGRAVYVVAENEPQDTDLVRPREAGGCGLDGLWNDDLQHSALVALTGRNESYYVDYEGTPQELIDAARFGYLFQGQRYAFHGKPRGVPAQDIDPAVFVTYLENHDQIANSVHGRRVHQMTSPGRFRAMTGLLLLVPGTPMLFQGQEFNASTPFHYFADHEAPLSEMVRKGRIETLAQFPSYADPACTAVIPTPHAIETFARCRLDWSEVERHASAMALHRDLLALRRTVRSSERRVDGAVLGPEALALRFTPLDGRSLLLLVNLGLDLRLRSIPSPLVAPPRGGDWAVRWSSEHPTYGGSGTPEIVGPQGWTIPGHAAILLAG
ncbi:malto-oligosyltrehalose trehalohydrolase [Lichenihabitans sp. Uapishka_5]|uniref:malto-oligosyltrehalose trehalohydrolase n=1 Tax=Lichenihabitans sp. Uapishka_5 TaxID=3037302 RepID=UPI0029E7F3FE|nr:malto-oligosyltrehalose trehalohydrolase [Lichenihabitans sp. Uapishka_5]MDX7950025.1 malto-oligosyltrehalose trehalohydrolase [Lichenihabitans sp. Uapishka_5]